MRRSAVLGVGASALLVLWACVGDDPALTTITPQGDAAAPIADATIAPNDTGTTQPADSAATDVDGGPCDPTKDFGAPVALTTLNTGVIERSISLLDTEKTAFFVRDGATVMVATRPSIDSAFGAPTKAATVNDDSSLSWLSAFVTPDGQVMYLATTTKFYVSTSLDGAFGVPSTVDAPGSSGAVGTVFGEYAFTSTDKSEVFFDKRQEGTLTGGLYHAQVIAPGSWNTVAAVDPMFVTQADHNPVLSADGLTLYFSGTRNSTSDDVLVSTRPSVAGGWTTPKILASVSSTALDSPNWISSDGCRLYLTSTAHGNEDLYVATRPH